MGLGYQIPAISKGRPKPNIRYDGQRFAGPLRVASETAQMAKIDTRCGKNLGLRCQVGRRKTERPTPPFALDHLTSSTEGPPEKQRSLFDVSAGQ
jgi:hypothetical protein